MNSIDVAGACNATETDPFPANLRYERHCSRCAVVLLKMHKLELGRDFCRRP